MENQNFVTILFGSHLYGTNTPDSDLDYKGIYFPSPKEILLGSAVPTITRNTKVGDGKNGKNDVDIELWTINQFVKLVTQGQTVAMDFIFAPPEFIVEELSETSREDWTEFQKTHRPKMLSRRPHAFIGYCKQQANKYGIKGSRIATVRAVLNELEQYHPEYLLEDTDYEGLLDLEGVALVTPEKSEIPCLEVCGKLLHMKTRLKFLVPPLQKFLEEYGKRALLAEKNEGVDWKALSHAVRVGEQAIELLTTHNITFPRPNAKHLLDIKLGKLPYQAVAEEIDNLLVMVKEAEAKSTLPENPDIEFLKSFVAAFNYTIILEMNMNKLNEDN